MIEHLKTEKVPFLSSDGSEGSEDRKASSQNKGTTFKGAFN